jgi:hypothetical protein
MARPEPAHDQGRRLLPPGLEQEIEDAVQASTATFASYAADNRPLVADRDGQALAIKYVPVAHAQAYRMQPNRGLYIGSNAYTWGRGVYVVGVEHPTSTAIYGRVGVVSRYDGGGWRAFDARDPANKALYIRWLQAQPTYEDAILTVHSEHFLHQLRNRFREQFTVDVVMFYPDEADRYGWYTQPDDTWLAVTDWNPLLSGVLADGYSMRFYGCALTIVIEEEFKVDDPATTRTPYLALNPGPRMHPANPAVIRNAYANGEIVRGYS